MISNRSRAFIPWLIFGALLIFLSGAALRLGYLWSIRDVIDPDEAVIGLMARHILNGELPVFMYGQAYNGSLESFLIAPFFSFFGANLFAFRLPPLILSLAFPFLCGFFAKRLYGNVEGVFAFILSTLCPVFLTGLSVMSWGNYAANLVVTSSVLILAHEIAFKTPRENRARRIILFALFGFISGLGWWAHPSIVLPVLVSGLFIFLEDKLVFLRLHFWICVLMFFTGSLPLWIYNFHNGFVTLRLFTDSGGHFQVQNLVTLFTKMVPAALGITQFASIKYFSWSDLVPYISRIQLLLFLTLLILFFYHKIQKNIFDFNLKCKTFRRQCFTDSLLGPFQLCI